MFLELQLDIFQVNVHFKHHLNTSISFHLSGARSQGPDPDPPLPSHHLHSYSPFCFSQASHLAFPVKSNIPGRASKTNKAN